MMDLTKSPAQLKASILQDAMMGKLTQQLPEDGDAKDLLTQINAEKDALIKAKKIKKQKALPEIEDDEIPFEIPDNWQWVRLGEIALIRSGKRVPKGMKLESTYSNGASKYLRVRDMKNNSIDENNLLYANKNIVDKIDRYRIYSNDLYITVAGTIAKVGMIPNHLSGILLTENADRLTPILFNKKFFLYSLLSSVIKKQISELTNTVAQPKLSIRSIKSLLMPLPPLSEQKRIVEKLNSLLPKVDEFNHSVEQLHNLREELPSRLSRSFLQSAMMGKLTKQLPEDGDASELLEQIKAEKEALVKAKKIKAQKPMPEIAADEIPFEIPDNWQWVRLGEIVNFISGRDVPKTRQTDIEEQTPYITGASNINNGLVSTSTYIKDPVVIANKGDLLITVKGTVGKLAFLKLNEAHIARQIISIKFISTKVDKLYVYYLLTNFKSKLVKSAKSMIPGIRREDLINLTVPLPPLSEQKRIVNKLDKLLSELNSGE